MVLGLADTVHGVWLDGGLVLLDIGRDAYLCLPAPNPTSPAASATGTDTAPAPDRPGPLIDPATEKAMEPVMETAEAIVSATIDTKLMADEAAPLAALPPDLAESLVVEGLLRQEAEPGHARQPTARQDGVPVFAELADPTALRCRPGDLLRFVRALAHTTLLFRTRRFETLLAHARDGRPAAPVPVDPSLYAREAALFDRLVLMLPVRIECLFRSFLLLDHLRRRGLDADWVFGVGLHPFRAHCWLQRGDTLVGERAHVALAYRPILRIGAGSA